MRVGCVLVLAVLVSTGTASALTPTFDGLLGEWWGDPGTVDLGSQPAPDVGGYNLLANWDATDLYLGMARDSSDRYLGDTYWDNDSFFVAIDVDGVPNSGASSDGYSRMNFGGAGCEMLPDVFYAYAGGGGWHEWASWNGGGWDFQPWSNAGTYYGWSDTNPDDELGIPLANIGGSADVMVWAWMTRERGGDPPPIWVEASWPAGATGEGPTMGCGINLVPEPASLLILLGGAGLLRRRRS